MSRSRVEEFKLARCVEIPDKVLGSSSTDHIQEAFYKTRSWIDPDNRSFCYCVQGIFEGAITVFAYDAEDPQRLKSRQVPGTTLMIEPYALKVSVCRPSASLSSSGVNKILYQVAKLINADLNIKHMHQACQELAQMINLFGITMSKVLRLTPQEDFPIEAVIVEDSSVENKAYDKPENFFRNMPLPLLPLAVQLRGNIKISERERQEAVTALEELGVSSLWSTAFAGSQEKPLLMIKKFLQEEERAEKAATPIFHGLH